MFGFFFLNTEENPSCKIVRGERRLRLSRLRQPMEEHREGQDATWAVPDSGLQSARSCDRAGQRIFTEGIPCFWLSVLLAHLLCPALSLLLYGSLQINLKESGRNIDINTVRAWDPSGDSQAPLFLFGSVCALQTAGQAGAQKGFPSRPFSRPLKTCSKQRHAGEASPQSASRPVPSYTHTYTATKDEGVAAGGPRCRPRRRSSAPAAPPPTCHALPAALRGGGGWPRPGEEEERTARPAQPGLWGFPLLCRVSPRCGG